MAIQSNITALQDAIVTRLASDSFFTGAASPVGKPIKVIASQPWNLLQAIAEDVGKMGLVVVVMVPESDNLTPYGRDVPALGFKLTQQVLISEDGTINFGDTGTQVKGTDVVGRVLELIHFWSPGVMPSTTKESYLFADKKPWHFLPNRSDPTIAQYACNFYTYLTVKTSTV